MDKNIFKGQWKQVQGEVKRQWGKLTDDDLKTIDGNIEKLEGQLQQRYGFSKDEAHRRAEEWFKQHKW